MSDVHFFIDPAGISSQSASQKFGPVNANEYRITSSFAISGSPMAYAICRGRVLVQPQAGTTGIVNLILKPIDQPIEGLNIKYFVYRGLSETDFFTTSGTDKVVIPASGASELIAKIRTEFTSFHNLDPDPEPPFLAKFIGFDPSVSNTEMIDNLFFKESDWNSSSAAEHFELPMIVKGKSLGKFSGTNCGIDVAINYGDYMPNASELEFIFDLGYARAANVKILPAGTEIARKVMREQIHQFLDIAAFYGYFHPSTSGVGFGPFANGTQKIGDSIYSDLLDKFATKNRLYVYLSSDRKRSYNFYNNYLIGESNEKSLKIGVDASTVTPLIDSKYRTLDSWPILIDEFNRASANSINTLNFQLVCNADTGALFATVGAHNSKISEKWLLFGDIRSSTDTRFTKIVSLNIPAIGGENISSFYFLIYKCSNILVQSKANQNLPPASLEVKIIDDSLFGLKRTTLFKSSNANIVEESLVDLRLICGGESIIPGNNKVSIAETVRLETTAVLDSLTVNLLSFIDFATHSMFIADVVDANANQPKVYPSYITKQSLAGGFMAEFLTDYEIISFTDNTTTINSLRKINQVKETNHLLFLGITQTESAMLKQVIQDHTLINHSVYFLDISPNNEPIVSTESIEYSKYRLGILGEVDNSLGIYFPVSDVVVYHAYDYIYMSKAYSDTILSNSDMLIVTLEEYEKEHLTA